MKRRGRRFTYSHDREAAIVDLEKRYPWVCRGNVVDLVDKEVNWDGKPILEYRFRKGVIDVGLARAKTKELDGVRFIDFRMLKVCANWEFGRPCKNCGEARVFTPFRAMQDQGIYCEECYYFAGPNAWKRGLPKMLKQLKCEAAERA